MCTPHDSAKSEGAGCQHSCIGTCRCCGYFWCMFCIDAVMAAIAKGDKRRMSKCLRCCVPANFGSGVWCFLYPTTCLRDTLARTSSYKWRKRGVPMPSKRWLITAVIL